MNQNRDAASALRLCVGGGGEGGGGSFWESDKRFAACLFAYGVDDVM